MPLSPVNPRRRRALAALLASPLALAAAQRARAASGALDINRDIERAPRFALLLGNERYPTPFDLPPVPKNVRDLKEALEARGFKVTTAIDQDTAPLKKAVADFNTFLGGQSRDAIVLVYFTGHGLQEESENLLVAADVNPSGGSSVVRSGSLKLSSDVIGVLPKRPDGLSIAIIDACRTSLKAVQSSADGLNQVEPDAGWLISYSTGAGRPAIAPAVPDKRTFYTDSLIKQLGSVTEETSFSELFQLVKRDVNRTMLNHPVKAIQAVAQNPFTAENLHVRVRVTPPVLEASAVPMQRAGAEDEAALWKRIDESLWPAEIVKLADDYLYRFPTSPLAARAQVARDGADDAVQALKRREVRLYRSAFAAPADAALAADMHKAARGDKDAAARIAASQSAAAGGSDNSRYEGWMQYAAELGNGIASYKLARHYLRQDQPQLASRYEARARELGYTPPPTLDNVRK